MILSVAAKHKVYIGGRQLTAHETRLRGFLFITNRSNDGPPFSKPCSALHRFLPDLQIRRHCSFFSRL